MSSLYSVTAGEDDVPDIVAERRDGIGFTASARLRFVSTQPGQGNGHSTAWTAHEKADLKLASLLHYTEPSTGRGLPVAHAGPGAPNLEHGRSNGADASHNGREADLTSPTREPPFIRVVAGRFDGPQRALGLSSAQYDALQTVGGLPLDRVSWFEEKGEFGRSIEPGASGGPGALCLWVRTPDSFVHDLAVCVRADLGSGCALAAYFDRNEERTERVLAQLGGSLRPRLQSGAGATGASQQAGADAAPALALLAALLAAYHTTLEQWRVLTERRVRAMEDETGARSQMLELEPDKTVGLAFGRRPMSTSNLTASLVALEHVAAWSRMAAEFVAESAGELEPRAGEGVRSAALAGLRNHIAATALTQSRVAGLQKRMQSQTSILLSLISQRDSRATILLAQESHQIAAAAKQDSKVMRVIAVLGLIFLPASLVASVFSSGIFELGIGAEQRVSPLWWVYVVASVAGTAAVGGAGWMFLRLEKR